MIRHSLGKIDCYGKSKQHAKSKRNADHYLIADFRPSLYVHGSSTNGRGLNRIHGPSSGQLLVVADGVGDRRSAARASTLLVDTVNQHLLQASSSEENEHGQRGLERLTLAFEDAIQDCRHAMRQEIAAADRFEEMGAVITLAYIVWPKAIIMHVGNNRAFHWRQRELYQVTTDHTMAGRLVEAGQLSQRRARKSHLRHVVWNHVGTQSESVQPDYHELDLTVGDALVLCSNGMAESLVNEQLFDALDQDMEAEETCHHIFRTAEARGFQDDATAIVAKFWDARTLQRPTVALARPADCVDGTLQVESQPQDETEVSSGDKLHRSEFGSDNVNPL